MSRTARSFLRRRRAGDEGFTLLEVIVSLGLFAIFAAAMTPILISATRATLVTKLDTAAKNLSQERFEVMRNMPYHLDVQVDTTPDLLDTYFPNLAPAPDDKSAGYVNSTARRAGEPAEGPFYRTVFAPVPGFERYTQYVATQFLDAARRPVAPPVGYDSQRVAFDQPPSLTVGITVVTVWRAGEVTKSMTVFSEIADGRPMAPRVTLESRVAALRVQSVLDSQDLMLEAGVLNLDGSLTTGSSAGASARGAFAAIGDTLVAGARRSVAAPPAVGAGSNNQPRQELLYGTKRLSSFGRSEVRGVGASTPFGEPTSGSASSPVVSGLYGSADSWFTNVPDVADAGLLVLADRPVVSVGPASSSYYAESTGWMRSTGGASHAATTSATAATGVVRILPTAFAPGGLIQVQLNSAALACTTNGTTGSTVPEYRATLRFWRADPTTPGVGAYVDAGVLSSDNSSDPLASALNLTVGAGGTVVHNDGVRQLYLGEYFKTLSSQTTATLAAGKSAEDGVKRMKASYAGMVSIATVPLRAGDELSNVSVQLGALSCLVEDNR